MNSDRVKQLGT